MISQNLALKKACSLLGGVLFIILGGVLFIIFSLHSAPVLAMPADIKEAQHQYQVDVILFRQDPRLTSSAEEASPPTPLLLSPNTLSLNSMPTLSASQSTLVDTATRLSKNPHYTLIWQGSWIQTIRPASSAQPLRIQAGQSYPNGLWEIDGTLTLSQQNYINVSTDLRFTEANQGYPQWNLKQTQRMRPEELHYFDHPLFGLLIQVSPYSAKTDTQGVSSVEP